MHPLAKIFLESQEVDDIKELQDYYDNVHGFRPWFSLLYTKYCFNKIQSKYSIYFDGMSYSDDECYNCQNK